MNVNAELQYARLDNFYLDTKNPRLGRFQSNRNLSQEEVLDLMRNWVLDELAGSYLENGFWQHEALLVVKEELCGKERLVVVEGNRRLAALIYLCRAVNGNPVSKKWGLLVENREVSRELFDRVPYIQVETRETIEAFQGFRHMTGIKNWYPLEKTRYIGRLIDDHGMTYKEVALKIGSYTSTVRHHYISYRLVLQIESILEGFSFEDADSQFSTLYHLLRKGTVQEYLNIDSSADPHEAQTPVPKKRLDALAHFAQMGVLALSNSLLFSLNHGGLMTMAKFLKARKPYNIWKTAKNLTLTMLCSWQLMMSQNWLIFSARRQPTLNLL